MNNIRLVSTALSALKRHGLIFTVAFISTFMGSVIYLLLTPYTYVSSARIMLDEGEANISDLGRALSQLDSPGAGSDPLATQSELITSEVVYARALEKLKEDNVQADLTTNKLDENLKVRVIPATNILELNYSHEEPEIAAIILNSIVQSTAEINGENIRKKASQIRMFLEEQLPDQEANLKEAEDSERRFRQESGIVSLDAQVESLVDSLSALASEERQLVARLEELKEKVRLLQDITGARAIEDAYESVRIGQDETLDDLRGRLVNLEASIVESSSRLGDQNPELLALYEQREQLQLLYQRQLAQIPDSTQSSPNEYLAVSPPSQDLMNQLIADIIAYESLNERLVVVQSEIDFVGNLLVEIPALSQPLAVITRQRNTAEETLRNLRVNLEEAQIAEAQIISNISVLGEASVPDSPSAPSKPAVLLLGLATGLVLACGLLVLLETIDNTLHSSEEAKAWLGYPIVGELPYYNYNSRDIVLQNLEDTLKAPKLAASYHSLINALRYYSALEVDKDPKRFEVGNSPRDFFEVGSSEVQTKTILLSSSFWGEGKSLVLMHLAAVNAMLGKRTLVVDADLFNGHQSSLFNCVDAVGLSDVVERKVDLLDACHMTSIENLSILSKGRSTNQPAAIMDSSSMKEVIEEASNHYDCIIVDIPPITESPACVSLSQYVGGLFLIVRPDFKSKHELRRATSDFIQFGGKIFGQIINRQNGLESEIDTFREPMLEESSLDNSSKPLYYS